MDPQRPPRPEPESIESAVADNTIRQPSAAWPRWVLGILLVGAILRFSAAFPVHRYAGDSDSVGVGLCTFRVLRGETPVFYSGSRLGSLPCHLTAPLFALFGASRATLALVPVLVWCLVLSVGYPMYRELIGSRLAPYALVFLALPPSAVTFWTYLPIGYAETVLLCAVVLWLAARLARLGEGHRELFGLGLAAGLAWWNNLLSLGCSVPAVAWLLWRRPRLVRPPASLLFAAGLGLGAFPWLAFNLRFSFASLTGNFHLRPTDGMHSMLDNAVYLVTYRLRELVTTVDPVNRAELVNGLVQGLGWLALSVNLGAVLFFLLRAVRRRGGAERSGIGQTYGLFLAVAGGLLLLNLVSGAGALRGPTVRYVLPLYLLVPAILTLELDRLSQRSRRWAGALATAVLAFNLTATTMLPWTEERRQRSEFAREDARLVEFLRRQEVETILGPYWAVYSVNFLSHGEILAIPLEAAIDAMFRPNTRELATAPRWALVDDEPQRFARWLAAAGLDGEAHKVGRYSVYLPAPELYTGEPAESFRDRLRQAFSR